MPMLYLVLEVALPYVVVLRLLERACKTQCRLAPLQETMPSTKRGPQRHVNPFTLWRCSIFGSLPESHVIIDLNGSCGLREQWRPLDGRLLFLNDRAVVRVNFLSRLCSSPLRAEAC